MSPVSPQAGQAATQYRKWVQGSLIFLAALVVARFILEVAGVSHLTTRYLSSSAAIFLAAIYLGVRAHLYGVTKFTKTILPAIIVAVWTVGWVILATIVSAVLRLEKSHFAEKEDFGNWSHLGRHIAGHLQELIVVAVAVAVLMAVTHQLGRWPVTVGPGAILGSMVILRYWSEAMGMAPAASSALSTTVGIMVCGLYLGGVGPHVGLVSAGQLFVPAMVIGLVWRFWIFLAAVLSAVLPFYQTHFFDPSGGNVAGRLARSLGSNLVEGIAAGVVVWGLAVWILRAMRPAPAAGQA